MKTGLRLVCCCGLLAVLPAAADQAAERRRIDSERRAIEARFDAEEAACRERFVVASCVDDVRLRKREALAGVRAEALLLDDAERQARAAARLREIESKRLESASRPPAPPQPPPKARHPVDAAEAAASARPPHAAHDGAEAEAAARRASASEIRRIEAEADRARIAAREAERDPNGKKSAPLPPAPEAPARKP